jgi:hypothetical protein
MNRREALAVVDEELATYRSRTHAELQQLLDDSKSYWVRGPSGANYQIKVFAVWDGGKGGDLRVIGQVDDGGWRAFVPLSRDFILSPSGKFVGE